MPVAVISKALVVVLHTNQSRHHSTTSSLHRILAQLLKVISNCISRICGHLINIIYKHEWIRQSSFGFQVCFCRSIEIKSAI